jgi:iron complex transport system substrate-binding protein
MRTSTESRPLTSCGTVPYPAERIVCLTEETVETLYLLGEERRIVGVSGYAVRPARVRREKPRVSAFISADIPKILALEPDLVLAFSDLQADIVRDLIKAGVAVHVFNHRDVAGIYAMIRTVGALVAASERAEALAGELTARVDCVRRASSLLPRRPRVYFEEWDDPMICGIRWVSELIEIAGGEDVFAGRSRSAGAHGRIVTPGEVSEAAPDVIIGSWCGKKFAPDRVRARPELADVPAVRRGALHEIKAPLILQPGPAALTDGVAELQRIIAAAAETWAGASADASLTR